MASRHEDIMSGIVTTLRAIEAGTNGAAYTPDLVARVAEFSDDQTPFDSTTGTVYYVRPGEETRKLGPTGCDITANLPVFILAAREFGVPSEKAKSGLSDERGKIQAELAADISYAIFQDFRFGIDGDVRLLEDTIRIDYDDRFIPKWANVEVSFIVQYRYKRPGEVSDNKR